MKKVWEFFLSKIDSWTHTEVFLSDSRKKKKLYYGLRGLKENDLTNFSKPPKNAAKIISILLTSRYINNA